ncbi:LysR substrate-binding domain-containing protein [Siccirubricoccus sp. KC 17139]|uniref:LysR substrate-binding domain-containing protein n=1 Tax=Siccirubricoccus soli TaxID=2899147 RepID=A0ABT1D3K8_9PROT|nr:LysR substrate-binding domain-containing protein [Siccirubricoccus soli]MCO6416506.1 LysR substrate-binding domain-containing protein [Siccirubricoccus soli]MCP2682640.1 LysR substrate-binding domain-containing protein [Siccirubricoccus soli]
MRWRKVPPASLPWAEAPRVVVGRGAGAPAACSPAPPRGWKRRSGARLPAIHVTAAQEDWAAWVRLRGLSPPDLSHGLRFGTIQMALDAAAQGLGVAIARLPVCADDIAGNRVRALDLPTEGDTTYWLVTRPGLLRQREGRLLAAWFRHELQGEDAAA